MAFAADDAQEFLRLLDEHAAWRAAVWRAVLADEFLELPELVRTLADAERGTKGQLAALAERSYHTALTAPDNRDTIGVVERNPAWTSQACPRCSHLGERFSPGGRGYPSRFRCGHCGWTGDANVVAALNLKKKWDRAFRYPTQEEAAEARRARKGGAAASREGSPETVGANVRSGTDAPAA